MIKLYGSMYKQIGKKVIAINGCVLMIVSLILFVFFLSVGQSKHKEPSDEVISQAGEETANIEPDAIAKPEESENKKEVIKCEHILSGSMWQYYAAGEIPFVDEETFELIREAYEEVDYSAEFEKGNPEVYEEYKQKFWYLFQNKAPFLDRKTGKELYIKDWFESGGNVYL